MKTVLTTIFLFATMCKAQLLEPGLREFIRIERADGYEMLILKSTKFGPIEYSAKILLHGDDVSSFSNCLGNYENASLLRINCTKSDEMMRLDINWGNADEPTQMNGVWASESQELYFSQNYSVYH